MKLLSKDKIMQYAILVLATMGIVKIIWLIIGFMLLDGKDIEYHKSSDVKALYYRTNFSSQKLAKVVKPKEVSFADTIDSIKLLAIYTSSTNTVVTVLKDKKSIVLSTEDEDGNSIDGYVLYGGTLTEALFERDGKNYRISIEEESENSKNSIEYVTVDNDSDNEPSTQSNNKDISRSGGVTTLKRDFIKKYTQDMGNIWKNIGINEKVSNGKIIGFQVNFVKRGSDFARLGLRRGDIITAINGNVLDNYAKALDIYKNINSIENLTLTIKRRDEEMELEYEIR